jgi:bla regulator protein BlaR1
MIPTTINAVLSLSGSIELSILVKATIILTAGLTAARLASRAQASVRHWILAATFGALIALPLVVIAAPDMTIQLPVRQARLQPSPTGEVGEANPPIARTNAGSVDTRLEKRPWTSSAWPTIARWGWVVGAMAVGVSLLMAVWRVRKVRRYSLPRPELRDVVQSLATEAGISRSVEVLEHEHLVAPLTCGLRRPAIVLPSLAREWNGADVQRALIHEIEHVRRADWVMQLTARIVCACYWFHPLAWMALRQMCLEAERACDDAVVRTAERTDYAEQLVLLARRLSATQAPAVVGMANRSDLSVRVAALLNDHQRRGRAGVFTAAAATIAATLLVMAIAPVRAVATLSPETLVTTEQRPREVATQQQRVRAVDRALYEAAEGGDIDEVDQLLQAGGNVNAPVPGDGSALIGAARAGRLSMVRHLLDRGADVNMPVQGDGNPLIASAREGATSVVQLLIDRGASIDQIVPDDETALIQASAEGHLDVVKLLVARGANVNLGVWVDQSYRRSEREWRSPLSMARKGRHASVVELLLAAGAHE